MIDFSAIENSFEYETDDDIIMDAPIEAANDDDSDDDNIDNKANVGETSVEIDVESLIAELEAEAGDSKDSHADLRRRLEDMLERKQHKHDLDDFEDYELD